MVALSFFTNPKFDVQFTCMIFPAGMVIFCLFTLASGAPPQLLWLCCISSTKDFILDLSTLSKVIYRILIIVSVSVLFCRRCLIALNPKMVLFIFCVVAKRGMLISVDLPFLPILTLISTYPSKGMSWSSSHWTLMLSQSSRIELICWILKSGKFLANSFILIMEIWAPESNNKVDGWSFRYQLRRHHSATKLTTALFSLTAVVNLTWIDKVFDVVCCPVHIYCYKNTYSHIFENIIVNLIIY